MKWRRAWLLYNIPTAIKLQGLWAKEALAPVARVRGTVKHGNSGTKSLL